MTPFESRLAAFEQHIAVNEPRYAGAVSTIINKYYRAATNFSGYGDAASDQAFSDLLTSSGSLVDPATGLTIDQGATPAGAAATGAADAAQLSNAAAATGTTNALTSLFAPVLNYLNNRNATTTQLAQLQTTAAAQQAAASGSASNANTMLIVGGVVAVIAVMALAGGGRRR